MIRHLRWLSRPVPEVFPGAVGLAVYAEPDADGRYRARSAAESGYEGVSCVDDVARAAILYCRIWRLRAKPWATRAARSHLAFVLGMQEHDGRFANFITDWHGGRNVDGPTSYLGGPWWTARALHSLATGYATFGGRAYAEAFRRGLPWLFRSPLPAGPAALGALAALRFWAATGDTGTADAARLLVGMVQRIREDSVLCDEGERDPQHLWARYQEVALTVAGQAFGDTQLIRIARASAGALLIPAAEAFASRTPTLPYEAGCVARALTLVARVAGDNTLDHWAERATAWFTGRNAAGVGVYDPVVGRVYDGVDQIDGGDAGAVRSRNAGAESNVEGAATLLDTLPWDAIEACSRGTGGKRPPMA